METGKPSSSDDDDDDSSSPVREAASILASAASDGKQQDHGASEPTNDGKTSSKLPDDILDEAAEPVGETVTHERR